MSQEKDKPIFSHPVLRSANRWDTILIVGLLAGIVILVFGLYR